MEESTGQHSVSLSLCQLGYFAGASTLKQFKVWFFLPFLLALVLVWPHSAAGQGAKAVKLTLQKKCRPFLCSLLLEWLGASTRGGRKDHLRYRDERVGILVALAQTGNHGGTSPTDFPRSLGTNQAEQQSRVRSSRNFSTKLHQGFGTT